jgi:non-canonical poly(A) RNA polymerase PAPD5/7
LSYSWRWDNVHTGILRNAAKALMKAQLATSDSLKIISKARIPLVKFEERHTQFTVDISFNQESGIDGSDNIKSLLKKYPAIRPLLLVLKQFLLNRNLNEVYMGGLGSYALTLMITSLLQLHPMIQAKWISPCENLGVLLIEFFELYGRSLSYEDVGISIIKHGCYFSKDRRGWTHPKRAHMLSVEDPYDTENDVTKGSFAIMAVKAAFQHAFDILSSLVSLRSHVALYEQERTQLEDVPPHVFLPCHSFLAAILRIDDRTLAHRDFIESLGGGTVGDA